MRWVSDYALHQLVVANGQSQLHDPPPVIDRRMDLGLSRDGAVSVDAVASSLADETDEVADTSTAAMRDLVQQGHRERTDGV